MSNSRLEKFIYAICGMGVDDLPTPLSRIEMLWNCLITGETPDFEPLSRNEKYLMSMLTGDVDALPEPTSRSEKLLYKIATGETDLTDVPGYLSRYEELLKHLIENGGIGGTDFEYVLYTLNDSFSTLYSTAEAPVESAILKGQTLVNLLKTEKNSDYVLNTNYWVVEDDYFKLVAPSVDTSYQWCTIQHRNGSMLQPNSKYLLVFDVKENSCNGTYNLGFDGYGSTLSHAGQIVSFNDGEIGIKKAIVTTSTTIDVTKGLFRAPINLPNGGKLTFRVMAIPYQDGMENWEIPYFEGIQSVKMPVLTTTGKNLWNDNWSKGLTSSSGVVQTGGTYDGFRYNEDLISTKPLSTLYFKSFAPLNGIVEGARVAEFGVNKEFLKMNLGGKSFTLSENTYFIRVHFDLRYNNGVSSQAIPSDDVLTFGMVSTSPFTDYEPYKTNILTVNESIELRGIGNGSNRVEDELDCLTGELTQRIGEIVFNGSENWVIENPLSNDEYIYFKLNDTNTIKSNVPTTMVVNVLTDKLKISSYAKEASTKSNSYFQAWTSHFIGISRTELSTQDAVGFKEWLSNNNIPIQYPLSENSIKTVVLSTLDQDGQPTKLSTFNDITHVSIEAGDLLPTIDLEVATKIEETLSTLPTLMNDISETQQLLNESIDDQAENINEVSTAITEIRSDIL